MFRGDEESQSEGSSFKTSNLSFRRDLSEGLSRIDPVSYILTNALNSDGILRYAQNDVGASQDLS